MRVAAAQAPVPEGVLVFVPARAPASGAVPPPATPSPRTIQSIPSVVEVFSCLLPQSSLGPVAVSCSACRASPRGSATLVAVYVFSPCYGILSIYKPPTHSVKECRFFPTNPLRPQRLCVILTLRVGILPVNQDNACSFPEHLLTVEMLTDPARDGRSCGPTSRDEIVIHSRIFTRRSSFPANSASATRPRECCAAAASLCQASLAKSSFRANAAG